MPAATGASKIYGINLIDGLSYDDNVAMIDNLGDRSHGMDVLDAIFHFHEHDETLRGRSLLLARIRLHTDRGLYIASGEGYGAKHAINEARNVLERRIRGQTTYGRTKKPPGNAFWDKRLDGCSRGDKRTRKVREPTF